jgi:serine phosphatase RsbU (regulator of sigma subunit)
VLIGVPNPPKRHATVLDWPGAVLCLYTDGLVERRGEAIDSGIAHLCAALTTGHPETNCATVMAATSGGEPHRDDIALLVFRREPAHTGEERRRGYEPGAP